MHLVDDEVCTLYCAVIIQKTDEVLFFCDITMYFIHCCHKRAEEFISLYDVLQMRQAYNVEKGLNL